MRKATTKNTTQLARLRVAAGLGQRELAERTGMLLRQIQLFESGARDVANVTLKNGLNLADALGVHPRELLQ